MEGQSKVSIASIVVATLTWVSAAIAVGGDWIGGVKSSATTTTVTVTGDTNFQAARNASIIALTAALLAFLLLLGGSWQKSRNIFLGAFAMQLIVLISSIISFAVYAASWNNTTLSSLFHMGYGFAFEVITFLLSLVSLVLIVLHVSQNGQLPNPPKASQQQQQHQPHMSNV